MGEVQEKGVALPLLVSSRVSPHVFGTHATPDEVVGAPLLAPPAQVMAMSPCER